MNEQKKALRKHIRELKRQFTAEKLTELSLPIMSELMTLPEVQTADIILMYYSLPDEVDTHKTVNILANMGKTVLLPRVIDNENMEIRIYHNHNDLEKGSFGIMEPTGPLFIDYDKINVAVVPGMSFDTAGHRLGRGKGYYDRFLPKACNAYKIGVCFNFQKQEIIPTDEHDITIDYVI